MTEGHFSRGQRLERYSEQHPQEVLLVTIDLEGEIDQVMIYKGFSSSLMRSTEFNPDIPMIPRQAQIIAIDRLESPYKPNNPTYLTAGLTWEQMEQYLSDNL